MIAITIHNANQQTQQRFDSADLILGRFPNCPEPHVQIDDQRVSRRHLLLRQLTEVRISLENVGRHDVLLPNGQAVSSGERREIELPTQLRIGSTEIQIGTLLTDSQVDSEAARRADTTALHTISQASNRVSASHDGDSLSRLGESPSPERLTVWFETLLLVQRSAVGSTEFYAETARALVRLVGLDRGLVLLREQDAWKTVAGHTKDDLTDLHFSRSILSRVLKENRTFYGNPDQLGITASLVRVEAVVASPIFDDQGNVLGALYGSRDFVADRPGSQMRPLDAQVVQFLAGAVTSGLLRLRMQEKLKATEQLAAVGQAIGYILHDLRGPLGTATQLLGMLQDGNTHTLSKEEQLAYVRDSVQISLELLNDSLEFCRGNIALSLVRGACLELLEKHLDLLRLDLKNYQVELAIDIPPNLQVVLDPARMARVLRNLSKNAAEALSGRKDAQVMIGASAMPGGVELWVADNGPGLPPTVKEKLFQPFATHGKRGGTGFGLAIARQLVEAHRGRISVTTGPGGTRFHIHLPPDAAPAAESPSSTDSTFSSHHFASPEHASPARKRILLAEDSLVSQRIVSTVLQRAGYEVQVVSNGQQALAACESGRFDLVLMDLEMPVLGGLEAARLIRGQGANHNTPIIALTAHETDEVRETCRAAGMDGFLMKPVLPDALLESVRKHIAAVVKGRNANQ